MIVLLFDFDLSHRRRVVNLRRTPERAFRLSRGLHQLQLADALTLGDYVLDVVLAGAVLRLQQVLDETDQRNLHHLGELVFHFQSPFTTHSGFAQIQQIIDMVHVPQKRLIATTLTAVLLLSGCCHQSSEISAETPAISKPVETFRAVEYETPPVPSSASLWSEEDLQAMALTLAGECYDDKGEDKRKVCEVILNRVSDGRFGGTTVIEVVSAENQFNGYWHQSRPVSENDLAIAEQTLKDWYNNGCEPLSEYLYFSAGDNRENSFH